MMEDITNFEEYASYTYSIPQLGSTQWSNITVNLKRKENPAYSIILTIEYSGLIPNESEKEHAQWFFDPTTEGSRIKWNSSDSFSAGLTGLAFQVIGDLPEAIEQKCYTPNLIRRLVRLFLERAFGEEGIRTLKMMNNGVQNPIAETFHSVLVNELFPVTGKESEDRHLNEIGSNLSRESQRPGVDSDRQIPKISSQEMGDSLGDEFGDDVPADDESQFLNSPRESDWEGDSSGDEVEENINVEDDEALLEESDEKSLSQRDGDSSEDEVQGNDIDDEDPDAEEKLSEEPDKVEVLQYLREYQQGEEQPDDKEEILEQPGEEEDLESAPNSELDGDSSDDEVQGTDEEESEDSTSARDAEGSSEDEEPDEEESDQEEDSTSARDAEGSSEDEEADNDEEKPQEKPNSELDDDFSEDGVQGNDEEESDQEEDSTSARDAELAEVFFEDEEPDDDEGKPEEKPNSELDGDSDEVQGKGEEQEPDQEDDSTNADIMDDSLGGDVERKATDADRTTDVNAGSSRQGPGLRRSARLISRLRPA
ncbi:hypothetical protein B0H14DRAFT_2937467 [Mycena olivaceomarginata]|nr:hypothetical protein B0H14DRAFT_2937467 [Mycena olivaceomarginata]